MLAAESLTSPQLMQSICLNLSFILDVDEGKVHEINDASLLEESYRFNNDSSIIEEVGGLVTEFRDTWKEVIKITRQQQYGTAGQV